MSWLTRSAKRAVKAMGWEIERRPDFMMLRRVVRRSSKPGSTAWQGRTGLRLNLGSGLAPLDGYVNIDVQQLPEVEVVAPVTDLSISRRLRRRGADGRSLRTSLPFRAASGAGGVVPRAGARRRAAPQLDPRFRVDLELYRQRPPGLTGEWFDLKHARNLISGLYTEIDVPELLHKDLFTKDSVRAELERAGYVEIQVDNPVYRDEAYPVAICAAARKPQAGCERGGAATGAATVVGRRGGPALRPGWDLRRGAAAVGWGAGRADPLQPDQVRRRIR